MPVSQAGPCCAADGRRKSRKRRRRLGGRHVEGDGLPRAASGRSAKEIPVGRGRWIVRDPSGVSRTDDLAACRISARPLRPSGLQRRHWVHDPRDVYGHSIIGGFIPKIGRVGPRAKGLPMKPKHRIAHMNMANTHPHDRWARLMLRRSRMSVEANARAVPLGHGTASAPHLEVSAK